MGNLKSIMNEHDSWIHQFIFGKHSIKLKVLMWGLPSSGKTSILKALTKLKEPDTITFRYQDDIVPTKTFNMQDFYHTTDSTYRIILYDVGGASGSELVKKFCHDVNAAVYAVDSSIKNKLMYPVVYEQLRNVCKVLPPSVPIVILTTKNDVAHVVPNEEILEGIKFEELKKHFPSKSFHVISCSSVDELGLIEILTWIGDNANLS